MAQFFNFVIALLQIGAGVFLILPDNFIQLLYEFDLTTLEIKKDEFIMDYSQTLVLAIFFTFLAERLRKIQGWAFFTFTVLRFITQFAIDMTINTNNTVLRNHAEIMKSVVIPVQIIAIIYQSVSPTDKIMFNIFVGLLNLIPIVLFNVLAKLWESAGYMYFQLLLAMVFIALSKLGQRNRILKVQDEPYRSFVRFKFIQIVFLSNVAYITATAFFTKGIYELKSIEVVDQLNYDTEQLISIAAIGIMPVLYFILKFKPHFLEKIFIFVGVVVLVNNIFGIFSITFVSQLGLVIFVGTLQAVFFFVIYPSLIRRNKYPYAVTFIFTFQVHFLLYLGPLGDSQIGFICSGILFYLSKMTDRIHVIPNEIENSQTTAPELNQSHHPAYGQFENEDQNKKFTAIDLDDKLDIKNSIDDIHDSL